MRRPSSPLVLTALAGLAAAAVVAGAPREARAQNASFVAELDRDAVAPGEPFVYQVTLTVGNENVDDFRAPELRGVRVLSAPPFPSRSTQMQIGGGQTTVQNGYSWRYELMIPSATSGPITIGAARVRVGGRELRSNPITIRVGQARPANPPPAARVQRGAGMNPFDPFAGLMPQAQSRQQQQQESNARTAVFIRAVADKTRVFVGEQVTVTWYLYYPRRPDNLSPAVEPRTDGFWSEDIPSTNPRGRPVITQENVGGQPYNVEKISSKALFPLHAGKLTVTPLEIDVAELDIFGRAMRRDRLKADPLTIEAVALPREEQPPGFDAAHVDVGAYLLSVRADRTKVAVGEAVTLTVEVRGSGNIRNVRAPEVPRLDGWKSYEPKSNVALDAGDTLSGTKTVEVLLLPERPGTTTVPALELATFDPATKKYAVMKSQPVTLEVTGDAAARPGAGPGDGASPAGAGPGGTGAPGSGAGAGVENVIAAEIRPIRARPLSRNVGASFVRSNAFVVILVAPPFALALMGLFGLLREDFTEESRRTRRRARSMVRRRLAAAEAHRDAGRTAAFYIEIDRVLREMLSARLGQPVGGLRLDELGDLLRARGMPAPEAGAIVAELEACDRARFAPGDDASGATAMASALERAGELIVAIEKAPIGAGGAA